MRDFFQNILSDYPEAYGKEYSNHPLAKMIRQDLPGLIEDVITDKERFLVKGSAGAGNWTATPWVAIFDILITDTAQSGFYPVYLFRDDMSGFYLSLNQGVTEIKEKYKRDAKQVLKLKAEDFRAQLGTIPANFSRLEIELKKLKTTTSQFPKLYEAGNVLAKYYSSFKLPSNEELHADLFEMLKIYEVLSYNEGLPSTPAEIENDEEKYKGYEDLKKIRLHKRIERNNQLSKRVKDVQGYTCKACKITFKEIYGVLGEEFIEAHHLIPLSKLGSEKIQLDIRKDFTVLCSNCHRMIHRLEDPSDLELLIKIINENKHLLSVRL
jgi:5-methylcytosine-specific restriction protein A